MFKKIDSDPIRIRAHHLLCMQGFQGYGYDDEFTRRMGEIIAFLESDPTQIIEITTEIDEICRVCPNLIGKQCVNDQDYKINKMDVYVIKNSNFGEKRTISFERALEIVSHDLKLKDINIICENCVWTDICLFYIKKIGL